MTDEMSNAEFVLYCRMHCNTPRAAFIPAQIARLLRLSGREQLASEWDALPNAIIDGHKDKVLALLAEIEQKIISETECPHCKKLFRNGDTCGFGGCPMGGDF